mgnify:CR=1 FL=1
MLDVTNSENSPSGMLKEWKKLSPPQQLEIVKGFSTQYNNQLNVLSVKDHAIELSLFMEKDDVYTFLVSYESYLREQLGNFPIIVLLKDRADENRKRK